MNGISGTIDPANFPASQAAAQGGFATLDRLDNGFAPPIPGQTREQWLDNARNSNDPALRAFYQQLVTLAGGRTDAPALNAVLDRYQAAPTGGTASERAAAERGWLDQIGTALEGLDPVNRLLDAVQPKVAEIARQAGLGESAWGASLQRVLDTPNMGSSFNNGLRAGIYEGGKALVVDTATLIGQTAQYGLDTGLLGQAGDMLRQQTGALPGWADAIVPSAERGAQTSAALTQIGGAVASYVGAVAADPAKLPRDVVAAIDAQWTSLQASHAQAAAKGPQAEARWWGETVGRVTFEVAATFVPVAGQVGKGAKAAKVADALADGVRTADRVGDATRVAGRVDDAAAAAQAANRAEDAGDAARVTSVPVETPQTARPRPDVVDGRPQLYFDDAGTKGSWRRELNRALKPDTDYHVNGYTFSTDAKGRVSSVEGRLTLAKAERNGYQQGVAGGADRLPDDQGGHLIASIFNGPGEAVNLKAMNGSFNMKEFRNLERTLEDALKAGKTVDVKIDIVHSGDSLRPEAFRIEYVIDGDAKTRTFRNQSGG